MSTSSNSESIQETVFNSVTYNIDEEKMFDIEIDLPSIGCIYDSFFSPNGEFLVATSKEEVYVIDMEAKRLVCTLTDHSNYVCCVCFSSDGKWFATGSNDFFIKIYDVENFSIVHTLRNDTSVYGIIFSHCDNFLYSGDYNGNIKKWDISRGEVILQKQNHQKHVWRLKNSPNGKYFITGSEDGIVNLIDYEDLSIIHSFNTNEYTSYYGENVRAIDIQEFNRHIAVAFHSGHVKIWNLEDKALVHTFILNAVVTTLQFVSYSTLCVMSNDGYLTSFNMDNYQEIQKIFCGCGRSSGNDTYCSLAYSPDRRKLACSRCYEKIRVYSIEGSLDLTCQTKLIELSKDGGCVLSNLIGAKVVPNILRMLVAKGIHMNQIEFAQILNTCWDLVDVNERNGGNMHQYFHLQKTDQSDDDDDDDDLWNR
eukprot:TRINITY_DN3310_c1_g2_i1.p1 TRINITY_DN3310_c1_g2~~TRINITY_DN3310_c1_g2_i1.p1  ORF type:complete len:423 (-),score=103.29 TRINITY_DN3310_c1_g2_i1:275-1543(-)